MGGGEEKGHCIGTKKISKELVYQLYIQRAGKENMISIFDGRNQGCKTGWKARNLLSKTVCTWIRILATAG